MWAHVFRTGWRRWLLCRRSVCVLTNTPLLRRGVPTSNKGAVACMACVRGLCSEGNGMELFRSQLEYWPVVRLCGPRAKGADCARVVCVEFLHKGRDIFPDSRSGFPRVVFRRVVPPLDEILKSSSPY